MGKDVIVACDFSSAQQVFDFLDRFTDKKPFVKIGMELFYAEGPQIIREIKARGHKIFLDLQLHDIPNTVKKAMAVLSGLDVDMCNVHAAGTSAMMKAALEGLTRPDGIRAALCWKPEIAALSRQHNDANVLALPGRFITAAEAIAMVDTFLSTAFEGGRHQRRIDKIPAK